MYVWSAEVMGIAPSVEGGRGHRNEVLKAGMGTGMDIGHSTRWAWAWEYHQVLGEGMGIGMGMFAVYQHLFTSYIQHFGVYLYS